MTNMHNEATQKIIEAAVSMIAATGACNYKVTMHGTGVVYTNEVKKPKASVKQGKRGEVTAYVIRFLHNKKPGDPTIDIPIGEHTAGGIRDALKRYVKTINIEAKAMHNTAANCLHVTLHEAKPQQTDSCQAEPEQTALFQPESNTSA